MGGRAGAAAVPARGRRAAAHVGVLRGEQGGLPRVRPLLAARRGAVDRRGVPRRARARAHPRRAVRDRAAAEAGGAAQTSGCRSRSASRRRSSSPRSRARRPSPTGCCSCRAGGELDFLHPLPVEALWGVGAVTAQKLHAVGLTTVGQVAALSEQTLVNLLGRASGRHLHALAHARDPRRVHPGRRRGSIGGQRAIGWRGAHAGGDRRDADRARRARHPPHARRRPRRAHGHAAHALHRLLARDALAHAAARDRAHVDDPRRRARPARRREAARSSGRASRSSASPSATSRTTGRCSSRCRSTGTTASASTRRSTRCARASAPNAVTRGVLLHRDQGLTVPLLPD